MKAKRFIAVLLSVVLVLSSMTGLVSAEGKNRGGAVSKTEKTPVGLDLLKNGALSVHVTGAHEYEPLEKVTAIVLMQGAAVAELPEAQRATAVTRTAKQHQALRNALAAQDVVFAERFEYSTLLNGLALRVAYKDLETVAALPGVKSVHIANTYDPPEVVKMDSSNTMTGAYSLHATGYMGSGVTVAVLDTGITPEHEAFQVYDGMLKTPALAEADAAAFIESKEYGQYVSAKIPFAYDYADLDDDATDYNGHGTHVSGIVAGYVQTEDGGATFVGTAPDAQLLGMKIFSDYGGSTDSSIYFAAIEDAYELGADVISMSIGAQNGFTYDAELESEVFGNIYQTVTDNGVAMVVAAGNEANMGEGGSSWAGPGCVTTDYADYGVVGSPSTYGENISVASAENEYLSTQYLLAGERQIPIFDSADPQFAASLGGQDLEYVVVPGFGALEDYQGLMIEGRVALVSRGELSFQDKLYNASAVGAAGLLVYNNEPGAIYMSIEDYEIPAAAISQEDGQFLVDLAQTVEPEETGPEVFRKVWDSSELGDGTQLLMVSEVADTVLNGASNKINSANNFLPLERDEEGNIPADGFLEASFLLTDSYLRNKDGQYLISYEGSNSIGLDESAEDLSIDIDEEGNAQILCLGNTLRYNGSWPGFRFFKPGSGLIGSENAQVAVYSLGSTVNYGPTDIGAVSFPLDRLIQESETGWEISTFSSMGVTPDLQLKPWITGIGGNVLSAAAGSENLYVNYSGTSMATPNVSGAMAIMLQFLAQEHPEVEAGDRAKLAEFLLESNARILTDSENTPYSPRRQGAGLIDLVRATSAKGYIERPVFSLGESADGTFELTFTAHNLTDQPLAYSLSLTALKDLIIQLGFTDEEDQEIVKNYNTTAAQLLEEGMLEMEESGSFCVPAKDALEVTLHFAASEALLEELAALENGGFVDGFVTLKETDFVCNGDFCPGARFEDMPAVGKWSHEGIDFAVTHGLFNGISNTIFGPERTMNRAMMVTVLHRLAGSPESTGTNPFSDVPAGKYYTNAVIWANENGIVNGTSPDRFNPSGNITREQLAAILYRYAQFIQGDTSAAADLSVFPDVSSVHSYAKEAMTWAVGTGIISGNKIAGVNMLDPRGNANRAQVATMFMRFCKIYLPGPEKTDELHVVFTGFVGDWSKAPILESHDWREIVDANNELFSTLDDEGNSLADYGYTYLNLADFEVNTDVNMVYACSEIFLQFFGALYGGMAGDNLFGFEPFMEQHAAFSPYGIADCLYISPMALRNARHMIMVVTDAETGEVLYTEDYEYAPKAAWDPDSAAWYSGSGFIFDGITDFNEETGEASYLPNGTRMNFDFYANLAYGEDELGKIAMEDLPEQGEAFKVWSFSATLDSEAPVMGDLAYDPQDKTLSVTGTDNEYLALMNLSSFNAGEEEDVVSENPDTGEEDTEEDLVLELTETYSDQEKGQSHTAFFEDVAPGEYMLNLADYATNMASLNLILTDNGELLPVNFHLGDELYMETPDRWLVSRGASITLPACEPMGSEIQVVGWIDQQIPEELTYEELEAQGLLEKIHPVGEEITVTEAMDLYPVAQRVTGWTEPDQELVDYWGLPNATEGTYALSGFKPGDAYDGDYFLNDEAAAVMLDTEYDDNTMETRLLNAPDTVLFDMTYTESYDLHISNRENGLYLAENEEGELYYTDNLEEAGTIWDMDYDEEAESFLLRNDFYWDCLVFDAETGTFLLSSDPNFETQFLVLFGVAPTGYAYFTVG